MNNTSSPLFNPKIGTPVTPDPPAERTFRELVVRVLKDSGKDRPTIAAQLSALTSERISVRMLNDWLAPSKDKVRFPASFVKALCEVTGDHRAAQAVMPERLLALLRIGECSIAARDHLRKALELIALAKQLQPEKAAKRAKR
jgi:hypothetical protein